MQRPAASPPVPVAATSVDQMAEEIFSLTVLGWRQRVASRHSGAADLSEPQFLSLDTLVHAVGKLTVGEIQRAIGVLPAQMSRIIRALEGGFDSPLIQCALNTSDRRKIDVTLTAEGRRVYDEFRAARLAKTKEILSHLVDHDRQEFVRICRRIRELYNSPQA